ncbi:MAG: PAS domain S-box protein [Alphaproteobacteria bacterium]|nr:PAS domain S-box protein [Alphaproteobacteria bacterium]
MAHTLDEQRSDEALKYAHALSGLFASIAASETEVEQGELLAQGILSIISCDLGGYVWRDDADRAWHLRTYENGNQSAQNIEPALSAELETLSDSTNDDVVHTLVDGVANSKLPACPLLHEKLQARTLAIAPVGSFERRFGFVLAGRNLSTQFNGDDLAILRSLSDYMAIMTDNRRRQAAIVAQERHFQAAFTNTPAMMYAIDMDSRFVSVSEQWLKVMGYAREEAIGRKAGDFLTEESRRRAVGTNIPGVLGAGIPQTAEFTLVKKNGETVDVILTSVADRDPDGKIIGANAALVDITERRLAEARVRELETKMHHISRLSAMGEMATGLAHELNQPLTAMINFVQASRRKLQAADGDVSEQVYEYMDDAVSQAARAGEIIRRLREFVQRGETERLLEDLASVVEEASAMALVGAADKGVSYAYELAPNMPPVLIDRIQIQQVVFNLVRNGVDALERAEERHLTISASPTPEASLMVMISDTGPGLPDEVAKRIFEPFVTTKTDGMGVGLSICRSIIDAHGGRLWPTPNSGGGTSFHFTLPLPQTEGLDEY